MANERGAIESCDSEFLVQNRLGSYGTRTYVTVEILVPVSSKKNVGDLSREEQNKWLTCVHGRS